MHCTTDTPESTNSHAGAREAVRRLQRESRRYRLRLRGSIACWSLAPVLFVVAIRTASHDRGIGPLPLLLSLCCVVAGALILPRPDNAALDLLARHSDLHAIGPLLEALDTLPETRGPQIRSLLTRLLPRLTAEDAAVLNRRQRGRLYDALLLGDADRDTDYLVAILLGLAQVGDEETLRCLEQLVRRGAMTRGQRRILEAAESCRTALEKRTEQARSRAGLLRAASPANGPQELLRPAASTPAVNPETLLHPMDQ